MYCNVKFEIFNILVVYVSSHNVHEYEPNELFFLPNAPSDLQRSPSLYSAPLLLACNSIHGVVNP